MFGHAVSSSLSCCSQFMLGGALLVNPKLDDNGTDVSG